MAGGAPAGGAAVTGDSIGICGVANGRICGASADMAEMGAPDGAAAGINGRFCKTALSDGTADTGPPVDIAGATGGGTMGVNGLACG